MAFDVRIYGHDGLKRMTVLGAPQFSSDSVYALNQPYLWTQKLTTNGQTAVTSSAAPVPSGKALDATQILRIEVTDGQSIRYEVNPPGRAVAAGLASPVLTGRDQIAFGSGWTLSIIDAVGTT